MDFWGRYCGGQVESALLHDGLDEGKGINDGMNL